MPVYCLLLLTPFDAIAHCLPCTFLRGFSFFSPSLLGFFFFLFRHVLQEVLHTSCTFFFPLSLSLYSSLVTALFSPYIHRNSLRVSNTWIMGRILLLFAPMHLSCCVVSLFKSQNCRGFIVILCELPCTRGSTGNEALWTALERKEKKEKRNSGNGSRPLLHQLLTFLFSTSQWEGWQGNQNGYATRETGPLCDGRVVRLSRGLEW